MANRQKLLQRARELDGAKFWHAVNDNCKLRAIVGSRCLGERKIFSGPVRERIFEHHGQVSAGRGGSFEELRDGQCARIVDCGMLSALHTYNCRRTECQYQRGWLQKIMLCHI
jgi:hypothetical protein